MRLDFEKFLQENDLKVGDRVKLDYINSAVYKIVVENGCLLLENVKTNMTVNIQLLQYGFEKLEPIKKVGDLTCSEHHKKYGCKNCIFTRLGISCLGIGLKDTLNGWKEEYLKKYPLAEPLRETFENELNKEIE